jgi:hypothetical protein
LRTSPISHAGLVFMLIGDAASFGTSWWRPRLGGLLLMAVSIVSLITVMLGGTREGFASLWLTGVIFWGTKVLLAFIMLHYSRAQLLKPA